MSEITDFKTHTTAFFCDIPVYRDARGYLMETFVEGAVTEVVSVSQMGVIRGLHFQDPHPQAKVVTCLSGMIFDVAVHLPSGKVSWSRLHEGGRAFIPKGYAHGFQVMSAEAVVLYSCDGPRYPVTERVLRWDDPDLGIPWPFTPTVLSDRDRDGLGLKQLLGAG